MIELFIYQSFQDVNFLYTFQDVNFPLYFQQLAFSQYSQDVNFLHTFQRVNFVQEFQPHGLIILKLFNFPSFRSKTENTNEINP